MTENKTKPAKLSVTTFVNGIEDKQQRADVKKVATMMQKATGSRAKMWGSNIVGYGEYHYKYESGREGDAMLIGYSPRKQALSIYVMPGFSTFTALLKKLGKHKIGSSCLYVKRLSDIDEEVLQKIIDSSVKIMRKKYKTK